MTTEEALQKAKNIDLQKELGVPIDPTSIVPKGSLTRKIPDFRDVGYHPEELLVDMGQPDAEDNADFYLDCLLEAARRAIKGGSITALHAADIRWVEIPDRTLRRGMYVITLLAPKPKAA